MTDTLEDARAAMRARMTARAVAAGLNPAEYTQLFGLSRDEADWLFGDESPWPTPPMPMGGVRAARLQHATGAGLVKVRGEGRTFTSLWRVHNVDAFVAWLAKTPSRVQVGPGAMTAQEATDALGAAWALRALEKA